MHASPVFRVVLAILALLTAGPPDCVIGQLAYRNLDEDRPTRVEDAYPAERYAFEFMVPYGFERGRGGRWVHASSLELEYGIARNAHVGVKAPLAGARDAGTTEWGLSGLRVFALYNFNTEGQLLPALSLRTDAVFPVGALAGSQAHVGGRAIATRSWGRNRIHLNAAYRFGRDGTPAVVEGLDRWWYGAALDRTLFRWSVLVVGELYARRPLEATPVEVNASLGLRWQWRPSAVIDVGVSRGLRKGLGPEYGLTVGVSTAFAIAGLMPGGR